MSRAKPCSADPDPCGLGSGFPGDAYCLKPPPAGEGIQIHFGPKSYTDPALTDPYLVDPSESVSNSMLARVPLTADRWFGRVTVHMRPGPHHWYSMGGAADAEEGVYRTPAAARARSRRVDSAAVRT